MPSRRWALVIEVHAIHEKGFQYECLASLEKCGDGKDIDVLRDVVLVICVIYGSIRDMEIIDSKNMRL